MHEFVLRRSQRIFCPPSRSKAKIKLEGLKNTLRMEYGPLNTPGSCTKHQARYHPSPQKAPVVTLTIKPTSSHMSIFMPRFLTLLVTQPPSAQQSRLACCQAQGPFSRPLLPWLTFGYKFTKRQGTILR